MKEQEKKIQKALGTVRTYEVWFCGYDPGYHGCGAQGDFTTYVDATSAEEAKQKAIKKHKVADFAANDVFVEEIESNGG